MADTKATALSAFTPILTDILYGVDDPAGTPISGKVTMTAMDTLFAASTKTLTNKTIDATANTVSNIGLSMFDTNMSDTMLFTAGAYLDDPDVTVASDGATITLSVEKSGGGDIRAYFLTGLYDWDTSPAATVTLTAGSDTSPQMNYVYMDEPTKTMQISTSGFPVADILRVASVLCQSAASLQTDGPMKVHAWTDHMASSTCGHLSHLNLWVRSQAATWISGVATTPTGGAATFDVATSSGSVLQLHAHSFPAFNTATGSDIYVVNDNTTAYKKVGDLTGETTDSGGTTMAGAWYNLVIWASVNEVSGDCKLFCNLPSGSYNNNNGSKAVNDDDRYSSYDIPGDFTGTGFLIAELTVSESAGTFTIQNNADLRGQLPSSAAGGGSTGGNEFTDNVFRIQDNGDITKEIAFEASGITTATTRTITMADSDVNLGDMASVTNLADTANGLGASLVGIEDSGALITATTVEGALAELASGGGTDTTEARATVINNTGGTLTNGTLVYISGNDGTNIEIAKTDANATATMPAVGMVRADIADAATGEITLDGLIAAIDTSAMSVNDPVYVSGTAGAFTGIPPTGLADTIQIIGRVGRSHATLGEIIIGIEAGGAPVADGSSVNDVNDNEVLEHGIVASSVNHIKITNAATGNPAQIEGGGTGSDNDRLKILRPQAEHEYNAQTGTTYTLVLGDQDSIVTMSNAATNTLTIPPNSSVAFPIGSVIAIYQIGAGATTVAGGTGVTLSGNGGSGSAYSADIQTQYNGCSIVKIATDQWMITGDIDAVAA